MTDQDAVIDRAVAALAGQDRTWAVQPSTRPGQRVVEVVTAGSSTFAFGYLQPGEVIHVELTPSHATELTVVGVPAGAEVVVSVPSIPATSALARLTVRDCGGLVRLVSLPSPLEIAAVDSSGVVAADDGVSVTVSAPLSGVVLELRDGGVDLSADVDKLRVVRHGTVRSSAALSGEPARAFGSPIISELEVPGDCVLTVKAVVFEVETLVGLVNDSRPSVTFVGDTRGLRKGGGTSMMSTGPAIEIAIKNARGVSIGLQDRASKIQGLATATDVTFAASARGGFEVVFGPAAVADSVTFGAVDAPVRLRCGKSSVLTNLAGYVVFVDAASSVISGDTDGLHVAEIAAQDDGAGACKGSVLTGVRIPTGLEGRRLLALLADVYHLTPDVRGIPGQDQTAWGRVGSTRTIDYGQRGARTQLLQDAEFVRELARLSREKGAPGSVVTKIAWCSYRLRALKANGRVERAALGGYRLIGYGERPVPAFLAWVVLAVALTGPVLLARHMSFEFSVQGWKNFGLEAGRLALGPAAVVTRSGSLSSADVAEIAARIVTSVPLVTGVLALRNYLKSDVS